MKKRALSVLLALFLALGAFTPALAYDFPYEAPIDIHDTQTEAASSELDDHPLGRGGIMPANLGWGTTRGRAAAYLVMGRDPNLLTNGNIPGNRFADVPMSDWAFVPIVWANNRGWINGVGDNRFNPSAYVARQDFIVMLVRAFSSPLHDGGPIPFTDANRIADWARPYVRRAVQQGWVNGFPDGTLQPIGNVSRGDAMALVSRASGRAMSDPVVHQLTWNANGGSGGQIWHRVPNWAIGPVPTARRADLNSTRWFNTAAISGGMQITPATRMPNGNITYTMRWHDSYRHVNNWWPSNTVPLRTFSFNPTWQTPMANGINAWNSSSASVTVSLNLTAGNSVFVENNAADWLGLYRRISVSGTVVNNFQIIMNERRIPAYAAERGHPIGNVIQSVMAHEIGHAVGLADNPPNTNSLMNTRRNRNTIRVPTAYDVQSVNLLY